MDAVKLSIGEIVRESWKITKKNLWLFAGLFVVWMLVYFLVFTWSFKTTAIDVNNLKEMALSLQQYAQSQYSPLSIIIQTLFLLFSFCFFLGSFQMALDAAEGKEPAVTAFVLPLRKLLNGLGGGILLQIVSFLFVALSVGACVVFVSGIFQANLYLIALAVGLAFGVILCILLMIRIQFYSFFILDKDSNFYEAIFKSWACTNGNVINLFLLGLVFVLINMIGIICCGIGIFVTLPMMLVGLAVTYVKLRAKS